MLKVVFRTFVILLVVCGVAGCVYLTAGTDTGRSLLLVGGPAGRGLPDREFRDQSRQGFGRGITPPGGESELRGFAEDGFARDSAPERLERGGFPGERRFEEGRFSLTFGLFGLSLNFIRVALIILLMLGLEKGAKAMSRTLRRPVA